jgi:hypothetical protein
MLLAYATHHGFKLCQMDVKSAFLNGPIIEEVYVEQPPGFESEGYLNHVYKLHKALYGLKQAPRAWYECLRDFLIENSFRIGNVDSTLFTTKMGTDLFVCQIYVDDIIFGSTNKSFCDEFSKIITNRFEMSMMGVLTFFIGFQMKPAKEGTFISQMNYTHDILKKDIGASSSGPSAKPKKLAKRPRPSNYYEESSPEVSPPCGGTPDDNKCLKMYSLEIHTTREIVNYSKKDPLNVVHLRNKACYNLVKESGTDERF